MIKLPTIAAAAAALMLVVAAEAAVVNIVSTRLSTTRVRGGGRTTVTVRLNTERGVVSVAARAQIRSRTAPNVSLGKTAPRTYSGQVPLPVNTTRRTIFAEVYVTVRSTNPSRVLTKKIGRVRIDPGGDPNSPPPPPPI